MLKRAVLINDTRVDNHHGCDRVVTTLVRKCIDIGVQIVQTSPAHTDWRKNSNFLKALETAHLAIVNGEGTIHHSRPAGIRLLEVGAYAKQLGIPAVLLNCTWEDNDHRCSEMLRDFALIASRDSLSAAQIRAAGVSCRVVQDLSFYGEFKCLPVARRGVGFTDSVLRAATLGLEAARRQFHGEVMPIQFSETGARGLYRFLRSYISKKDLAQPANLIHVLKVRLHHYFKQTHDIDEFISGLQNLELLVSGRYHACTLAMIARTPFVAISSNSHKIEALIMDSGLAKWRTCCGLDAKQLEDARQIGWEAGELPAVEAFVADARQSADKLFRDVAAIL